jgi:hypothetical protein
MTRSVVADFGALASAVAGRPRAIAQQTQSANAANGVWRGG